VLLTGQGPFRGSHKERLSGLLGSATLPEMPLRAADGTLVRLDEYRVEPSWSFPFCAAPLLIDPTGPGDLRLVGPAEVVVQAGLMPLAQPAFVMRGIDPGTLFIVGVAYDPFAAYGVDRAAEALSHRALTLQFGLEALQRSVEQGGHGTHEDDARVVEFLRAAVRWLTEEVHLGVRPTTLGRRLTLRAQAASTEGIITAYTFDFGDGTACTTTKPVAEHVYERYGTYEAMVLARSDMGGAAVWRATIPVQPDEGAGSGATTPFAPSCGGCGVGAKGYSFGGLLALLIVAWARRRRA